MSSKTVRSAGGTLCTVRPGKALTENVASHVEVRDVLVFTEFLKDHQYNEFKWPVSIFFEHQLLCYAPNSSSRLQKKIMPLHLNYSIGSQTGSEVV